MLKQIAQEFVNHGAKAVILMSRNKEKNDEVARSLGPRCHSEPGNVAEIDSCKQVCKNVVEKFG
jgi:peroxisomal 2,4-dienoyl-CoA reductase